MSKYKCENHKLDLICPGCVKAWIARHDKLLEFVKDCADQETYMRQFLNKHAIDFKDDFDKRATNLLKEIGET